MSQRGLPLQEGVRQRLGERYQTVDGPMLRSLAEAGLAWLRANQQAVNALNVFPVPDGDTGTNMTLTMQSACEEVAASNERAICRVAKAIAHGALMGARGNSGVILSQLWRGFARSLDDLTTMDAGGLVRALAEARDTAYKGVVQPVEGTILTVAKDNAAAAQRAFQDGAASTLDILESVVLAADESVQRTPDLLPVLKEAGVVDAGGKGLYFLLEGMLRSAVGRRLDEPVAEVQPLSALNLENVVEALEPGQDWEVVVDFRPFAALDVRALYERLESMGTSIQLGEGDGIYRMHIHVPDSRQDEPVALIQTLGKVSKFAVENLMEQRAAQGVSASSGLKLAQVDARQIGAVAVAPGIGIARVLASLGVAAIVEGGQTMNPSTQEILGAVESLPTDKVIILPNNKNIVLAAKQAADLTAKRLVVVPSVSVPQGIAALLAFDPEGDLVTVSQAMTAALQDVQTAELTVATRSVEVDGVEVHEGQAIGLLNGRLAVSGDSLEEALMGALERAGMDKAELVTLYYGAELPRPEADRLAGLIRQRWHGVEVEVHSGGQPHYQLILSIE